MANDRARPLVQRAAAGLALAVLLPLAAWRAYTLAAASYWAEHRPERALELRARFPRAEFALAERGIRDGEAPARFVDRTRAALARSPLDGRGYRYLGGAAQAGGDVQGATRLYAIAADRTPRDLPSLAWLGDRELASGNYSAALARLDRIMRVEPQREHMLGEVVLRLAATPGAQPALAKLLSSNPPWREKMLQRILANTQDAAAVFPLVESLRTQPGGLTERELNTWIDRLASAGEWGTAYLTWVQSLSPEASRQIGNVYNGSFELEPSQGGFDWRFGEIAGAHIGREQTTGTKGIMALRVSFSDERVPFSHVRQLLALPPGKFHLAGTVRLDDLRTERGLTWSVACVPSGAVVGQSEPLSGVRDWAEFGVDFEVPSEQCGGQWLTLQLPARIPAEQRIGGSIWFDDLRIKPR
jgi:tetratricopeptide (TPR) repeat protein